MSRARTTQQSPICAGVRSRYGRTEESPALTERCAFTILEVLIVIAIVAIALGIVSLAFRKLNDSNRLSVAAGTLTQYAAIARAYAMEHSIETMLVVNNANGRLELWHANPPAGGGTWDPLSDTTINPASANGYVYSPVLDSTASLPTGSDGTPTVVVHPIDYDAIVDGIGTRLRDTALSQENWDNLMWPAVVFDADGRLVQVLRRFATRLPVDYQGNATALVVNRRADGMPNVGSVAPNPVYEVDATDSRITSTQGFVVSDRAKYQEQLTTLYPTPLEIVNVWLARARLFSDYVRFVVVSPWSGRELAAAQ